MSVLVVGCGRSGTNLILEILRKAPELKATSEVEDKDVFKKCKRLPANYLSKCDTWYIRDLNWIDKLLAKNPELRIAFCMRDTRDMILSKIYRGSGGRDGNTETAEDATLDGCVADIEHMFMCWMKFCSVCKERNRVLRLVEMGDVILEFDWKVPEICGDLDVTFVNEMKNFQYRNQHKAARYKSLDSSQLNLWERKDEIYGGFFKGNTDILEIEKKIRYITENFGYGQFDLH